MRGIWTKTLDAAAIRNCNIKVSDGPFDLSRFTGGTNKDTAPKSRLLVEFEPRPSVEMWVYGDKGLLTTDDGRKAVISEFFAANRITEAAPVTIEVTQTGPASIKIRKATHGHSR